MYDASRVASPFYAKSNYLVIAFSAFYIVFGRVHDAFLVSMKRILEVIYSQALAAMVTDEIMYIVIWLLSKHLPNLLQEWRPSVGRLRLQQFGRTTHIIGISEPLSRTPQRSFMTSGRASKYGLKGKYDVHKTATARDCFADVSMLAGMITVFCSGVRSHD